MNYSNVNIKSRIYVLLAMVIVAPCCTTVIAQGQLKLVSIKPTVFFVREDNILTQIGEATINNLSQEEVQRYIDSEIPLPQHRRAYTGDLYTHTPRQGTRSPQYDLATAKTLAGIFRAHYPS